ncbi:MAG: hypothetical protein N4A38_04310 [Candidatus Gracilibacteria bacterium]|jgi:hypothetical protein|nr:hypothetical protein [Candidatus Gracilibacteria bacterium]
MKTSLKKLVAGASIATLVALNATFLNVNAANITVMSVNGGNSMAQNTQVTTVAFTPVTALENGGSFTISYPADMQDASLESADVTVDNGDNSITAGAPVVDITRNTIDIPVTTAGTANSPVTVTFANSHFATVAAKKNISFVVETKGSDGAKDDSGALSVALDSANVVAITARVAPILNMEIQATPSAVTAVAGADVTVAAGHHFQVGDTVDVIDSDGSTVNMNDVTVNAVAGDVLTLSADAGGAGVVATDTVKLADPYAVGFGTLQVGASNIRKMDIATASNAVSGIAVSLASTGLDGDNNKYIGGFGSNAGAASGTHDYRVVSATDNGGTILPIATMLASQTVLTAANPTQANATTTVSLDATIDGSVEAGNYSDTLTFTVTGNF